MSDGKAGVAGGPATSGGFAGFGKARRGPQKAIVAVAGSSRRPPIASSDSSAPSAIP